MSIVPPDDPRRYERVEDDFERVEDEFERVEEDEYERVEDDVEVVEDDVEVVAKPVPKEPVTVWVDAVYQYRRLESRAKKLREDIKFFKEALKRPKGCDVEKIRKHLRKLKRELKRVRKTMTDLSLTVYSNCTKKYLKEGICDKCSNSDICLRALRALERRKQKKIRGWFRR